MALYKLLCGVTVMILLTANGCHAIMPACGQVREGQDLDDHLPWEVKIATPSATCLGSLISPMFVLTDGQCRPELGGYVSLGSQDRNTSDFEDEKTVANVTCNPPPMRGLCLLKLDSPVNFTDTIYPICVASSDSIFHSGMDGYVATGDSDVTKESVPIVGDNECDCSLHQRPMRTICAGRNEQHNISMGDCEANLGGALMAKYQGYWSVIGVVNSDPNCPSIKSLRSYIAVASFADWIERVTNMSRPGFAPFTPSGPDPDANFVCSTAPPPGPPHPPTCIHPKPHPTRPVPCFLDPWSDDCRDDVFGSGVAIHSSPFILLCVLVLSFFGMNW